MQQNSKRTRSDAAFPIARKEYFSNKDKRREETELKKYVLIAKLRSIQCSKTNKQTNNKNTKEAAQVKKIRNITNNNVINYYGLTVETETRKQEQHKNDNKEL